MPFPETAAAIRNVARSTPLLLDALARALRAPLPYLATALRHDLAALRGLTNNADYPDDYLIEDLHDYSGATIATHYNEDDQ